MFGKRRRSQDDFDAEMQAHVELEADRLREEGMTQDDALAAACRAFGNRALAGERFYHSTRWTWWDDLRQDFKYACRTLRRNPGFAAAAVLTLALGIGANTGIFSVISAVLLKPLPYPSPNRLVKLYSKLDTGESGTLSPADFLDYRGQARSFEHLAAYRELSFNLIVQAQPERVAGVVATPDFCSVLGVGAKLGRAMAADQDKPGDTRVVVLSDALWRRSYGASPSVIGQSVLVDDEPLTVVGVMPEGFAFPAGAELWVSSRFAAPEHPNRPLVDNSTSRDSHYIDVIGRLASGVTLDRATAETNIIGAQLKQQYGDDEEGVGAIVVPLHDDLVGESRPALLVLLCAVALLLLIACVNVANIVLARGATRQREIAVRIALGAGRLRLVRQLLTESMVLGILGGALGILLAYAVLPLLRTMLSVNDLAGTVIKLDGNVLAFTGLISVASGIFFGIFPALELASPEPGGALKEGGRGQTGSRARRTRNVLVVSEIALATVLLIGAGLLIRSFDRLLAVPEGFNPEHVLSLRLSLPQARYPKETDREGFVKEVLERIRVLPAIRSAAGISRLPLNPGSSTRSADVQGRIPPPSGDIAPDYLVATPDYFQSMGIPLLNGRAFSERDDSAAPAVAIVNQATARYFWPDQDPLGKLIKVGAQKDWSPVVGVVADVEQHRLDQSPPMAIYIPYGQDPWPSISFVVSTAVEPASTTGAVEAAIHSVDKDEPVYAVRTMREVVAASLSSQRLRVTLIAVFAFVALVLACVGIYGVMSYSVAQRTNEIGIRMALGARQGDLLRLVVGHGLRMALLGVSGGLILSFGLARFLSGLLYGVRPTDATTFGTVSVLLAIVALTASYIPAWRATRVDPVIALRVE
jgi:putative ABC transport system permease protein